MCDNNNMRNSKCLIIGFLINKIEDFDGKVPSNSFFNQISKYSHPLF